VREARRVKLVILASAERGLVRSFQESVLRADAGCLLVFSRQA
jgi:F0F1-type ATP synthase gamma subunit